MKTVIDTLFLRRPPLNYLSPGICEAVFSSTGFPIIILPEFVHARGPTGLRFSGAFGHRRLSWNAYPNALCYNIYEADCSSAPPESLTYTLIAECVSDTFFDLPEEGCYRVSAVTPFGESDLSDPLCTCDLPPLPPLETPVLSRSGVILSWTVIGPQPETAVVERSTDGGTSWGAYGSAPWAGTLHVNSDFDYRVIGFSAGAPASHYSNVVNVPLHLTAVDWRARVLGHGGTLTSALSTRAQSDFCYYLDEHALRNSIVMINGFAPDSLTACLTSLIIPPGGFFDPWVNHNFVDADLTVNGLVGNGSDKFVSTGLSPMTQYLNDDSASFFVYEYTTTPQGGGTIMCPMGTSNSGGSQEFSLYTNSDAGKVYSTCWGNQPLGSRIIASGPAVPGFTLGSRTAANEHAVYFANSSNSWSAVGTSSVVSLGTRPNSEVYVFAIAVAGVGQFFYSDRRMSCAGLGIGLTSAQGKLLYDGIQALRTALGGGFV